MKIESVKGRRSLQFPLLIRPINHSGTLKSSEVERNYDRRRSGGGIVRERASERGRVSCYSAQPSHFITPSSIYPHFGKGEIPSQLFYLRGPNQRSTEQGQTHFITHTVSVSRRSLVGLPWSIWHCDRTVQDEDENLRSLLNSPQIRVAGRQAGNQEKKYFGTTFFFPVC